MSTPPATDLTSLNREIALLEAEVARLEAERKSRSHAAAKSQWRHRYLQCAQWVRGPRRSLSHYPLVVFAVGPISIGVAVFILLSLVLGSWTVAVGGFLVGTVIGAFAAAMLLFRPADELLPAAIAEAEANRRSARVKSEEIADALADVRARLAARHEQRRDLATSDKLQRAMLLQRNWKAMRGAEWEDFVVEVCRTLGANVHRGEGGAVAPPLPTGPTLGPRGVVRRPPTPLFVTFSPRRYAVAAISEIRPFHAAAVQQIVAELGHYGCDALAIITNTRVTTGSTELARSRNCTLLGEDEFPDFVLGSITL